MLSRSPRSFIVEVRCVWHDRFVLFTLAAGTLLLSASTAFAEGETSNVTARTLTGFTFSDDNANVAGGVYVVNIADCRDLIGDNPTLRFAWTLRTNPLTGARFGIKLQAPNTTCLTSTPAFDSSETDCDQLAADQSLTGTSVNVELNARDLFGISNADACLDGTTAVGDYRVYLIFSDPTTTTTETRYDNSPMRVTLDTTRPATPAIRSLQAGGTSIVVRFESGDDDRHRAYYSTEPFAGGSVPEALTGVSRSGITSSSSVRIDGGAVQEGRTYYVALVRVDDNGNESLLSAVQEVITAPTTDFWEAYQGAGGGEAGGYCAAGAGGRGARGGLMFALFGLLMARGTRRRTA